MSGICDTCQRLKRIGCGLVMDGLKSCDLYEHESRYDRLFGTPERAARTIAGIKCDDGVCEGCTLYGAVCSYNSDVMLEWLRGDA